MLFPVMAHSKCHHVINHSTVEPQNHVRIDFVDLVFVVTDYIVKTALCVNPHLHSNNVAVFGVFSSCFD